MRLNLPGIFLLCLPLVGSLSPTATALPLPTAVAIASKPVAITLTLVSNDAKAGSRMALTLKNTGDTPLPASGWRLFFNGGSYASTDANQASVKQVNGDLHALSPGAGFSSIAPGQSATLTVSSRRLRNRTDFPSGFYIVFDKDPAQAFPIELTATLGDLFEASDRKLTERIYSQNTAIQPIPDEQLTKVFPTPTSYQETGQPFVLDGQTVIVSPAEFTPEANFLVASLVPVVDKKLTVKTQASGKTITLSKNPSITVEGYELRVNQDGIQISASSRAGIFYGIQSLQTLIPASAFTAKANSVRLPGLVVKDAPRFGYRALMMDVARNFQPKSEVIKVLDLMGLYKLNVLHLHFSDDEGWRVEMPSLPELTTVGGTRAYNADQTKSLLPSYGSGPDASNKAGTGFYTKADFIEILKYARDRHIEVIPEIESPGHARAALRAMDVRYQTLVKAGKKAEAEQYLLRDLADKSTYESVQGWNDNVIDVALPSTYAFLERVVDDLTSMYREAGAPLKTIHVGGDEVPQGVWQKSPAVQRLMAGNSAVKSTDDLWYYYFGRLGQMLKKKGLFLSGWEEVGLKKVVQNNKSVWVPNPTFVPEKFRVNVWKNEPGSGAEDLAYRMANAGYKVILTGVTHLYLDLAYNPLSEEAGQYWGGYVDIDKPFYFIPYNYLRNLKDDNTGQRIDQNRIRSREMITEKGKANIVGIEAPLWAETNRSTPQFEYKLLPKLLAVAERAWAKDPEWAREKDERKSEQLYNRAWSEFLHTVGKRELPRLDSFAGGFQYRIPTAGASIVANKLMANTQFPGLTIRYTTDGTEPTAASQVYTAPLPFTSTTKLRVFNSAGRAGQTVTIKK
ncbi:family 20 glycosylhydrolase [Fibrella forsythiae]|uniref:beta-N-acetylhexosaminidase n=1 Tax=Fibrella forsythiae TaxID=2817061 RepID=A0ABS3JCG9_9BACT|nr:family 20 glycosylhydrolase [Fibrella forsythiae]MBO0947696.1 carbohydate-binding domain-containing protein [Fibrella forsythiae]